MATVGIDIGGNSVKAVRINPGVEPARARRPHDATGLDALSLAIRSAADDLGVQPGDRIGVCAPGAFEPDGRIVRYSANLPFLAGVDVGNLAARAIEIDTPPVVLTDAAASGLGAWHDSPIEGRLLVLAMGTGVGAALIDSDRLLTLDGVGIGHIGQIDVSGDDAAPPVGPDGGRGSLEAYVGGPVLMSRFGVDNLAAGLAGLAGNDPCIRALVRALRVCHAVYTPDVVRLVGGTGALFGPIVPVLHELVSDHLTRVARPGWRLETMDDPFLAAMGAAESAARS